ncbi:MAG: 50S ribosomal protein L19, partial [SAR202 cluster bacterium]|nr:50S ribosomal protein L19 [SAR202 cluster bacterium]
RRVSYEIGVERTFLTHSPAVEYVERTRRGLVKQARLYYLRGRSGRAARIKEDRRNR